MLKALPSHSLEPVAVSCGSTCNGITVSGNPCKQSVANGFYNEHRQAFCHNHQRQAKMGNIFLKERWEDEKPKRSLVTGKSNNKPTKTDQRADEDGSMRQLITQFKRLFHSASSAKYHDAAAVATKHVIPINDHKHHLPQVRRQPLQPLQPASRAVISPAALPITPSTPITEKVPILRQCQAINRHNGKQCSRTFKGEIESFCFQHRKIPLHAHALVQPIPALPNILLKDFGKSLTG
jgi:hypothetical protein